MPWFALLLSIALLASTALRLWLSARQISAVESHRDRVPDAFSDRVSPAEHQKAADYTVATARFGRLSLAVEVAVTLALTLGGGIGAIDSAWSHSGWSQPWRGGAVILTVILLNSLLDLPLSLWRTFRLEARFGFNRMTPGLFAADLAKGALLALLIGGPVVLAVLALMDRAGPLWWLWAWGGWLALILLITWGYPAFIAPLFNRFSRLDDATLQARIESLLGRCGFTLQGIFVVDGSRRSSHGNAYFTGIGRHKRIVFFDTLLANLTHPQVEAILAHELGHFRLQHVRKRLLATVAASFAALALLGWLAAQPSFYTEFGIHTPSSHAALLLFMYVTPPFMFFGTPLGALWSRRHEFEADAFAARYSSAHELAAALVKLYRENATTLTPDALYSAFYYSHPPATERIARLVSAPPGSAPFASEIQ
jgi:STE24 endopeptidase